MLAATTACLAVMSVLWRTDLPPSKSTGSADTKAMPSGKPLSPPVLKEQMALGATHQEPGDRKLVRDSTDRLASALRQAEREVRRLRPRLDPVLKNWGLSPSQADHVFMLWYVRSARTLLPDQALSGIASESLEVPLLAQLSPAEIQEELTTALGGSGYFSAFLRYANSISMTAIQMREPLVQAQELEFLSSVAQSVGAPSWRELPQFEHVLTERYGKSAASILRAVEMRR